MKFAFRIDLKRGKTFGFWQLRECPTNSKLGKELALINPNTHTIIMHNCMLYNSKGTTAKIFEGKMHKAVCAWIVCDSYEIVPIQDANGKKEITFNPRVKPYFELNNTNVDKQKFNQITTCGKRMYV